MSIASKAVIAGLAIFAMLFGSANIVFPIIIGKDYTSHFPYAIAGWLAADVLVPITGYFGSMLFDADNRKYLAPIGKYLTFLLMIAIMILVGPFGAIPRNVNVSFGGIHLLSPAVPEFIFNFLYCAAVVIIAWNPGKLVQIMGAIFTPLKLGGVAIVAIAALYFGGSISDIPHCNLSADTVFTESFKMGYQPLDLMASFIMSSVIFVYLKSSLPAEKRNNKKFMIKFAGMACLVSAIVLSSVYVCLVLIGAQYSADLQGIPDESLFPKIAELAMGNYASWFIAVIVVACCLATNIALASVFTDFVHRDILKEKFNRSAILILVGLITFAVSLIGFGKLVAIMAKVLGAIYPALIIFTFARIVYYYAKIHNKR